MKYMIKSDINFRDFEVCIGLWHSENYYCIAHNNLAITCALIMTTTV